MYVCMYVCSNVSVYLMDQSLNGAFQRQYEWMNNWKKVWKSQLVGDKPIPSVQSGQEVELEANENYSRVEGLDLGPPTTPGS